MKLPPEPKSGDPLSAAWGAQVIRYLRSITGRESATVAVSRTANGTTYSTRPGRGGPARVRLPFELEVTTNSIGEPRIRVYASSLAGGSSKDLGFAEADDPPYLLTPAVGSLVGGITINSSGEITSRWLQIVGDIPADTGTTFYVEIGTVGQEEEVWSVSNSRYGPISATICRNWFASSEPYYGVTWQ